MTCNIIIKDILPESVIEIDHVVKNIEDICHQI